MTQVVIGDREMRQQSTSKKSAGFGKVDIQMQVVGVTM